MPYQAVLIWFSCHCVVHSEKSGVLLLFVWHGLPQHAQQARVLGPFSTTGMHAALAS
jgi:hypothetical protein